MMLRKFPVTFAVVLAFVAALAVTLGVLQLHAWLSRADSNTHAAANPTVSEQEKMSILNGLSSSSTPSTKSQKTEVLKSLQATSASTDDQHKLDLLESLRSH